MRPRQRPSSTLAGDYRSGDKTCGEVLSAFRNMELAQVVLFFFVLSWILIDIVPLNNWVVLSGEGFQP